MENKNIYPVIKPAEEVNEMIKNKVSKPIEDLYKEKVERMKDKENKLQNLISRYEREKEKWGKIDSTVKISGMSLVYVSAIILMIVTNLRNVEKISLAGLTLANNISLSISLIGGFLSKCVSMGYTKQKKKEFNARIKLIKEYDNKVFSFMQKARKDGIITDDELKNFHLLIAKAEDELSKLKTSQTKKDYNRIANKETDLQETITLSEKETKQIEKKAKEEVKQELILKKKKELKKSLQPV